jgi:hypothetical protein
LSFLNDKINVMKRKTVISMKLSDLIIVSIILFKEGPRSPANNGVNTIINEAIGKNGKWVYVTIDNCFIVKPMKTGK